MAIVATISPPKQPAEQFMIGIDFSARLATGETITGAAVSSIDEATGLDSSATLLVGAESISGGIVSHKIHQGLDGESHLVTFRADTSANNILLDEIRVPVVA